MKNTPPLIYSLDYENLTHSFIRNAKTISFHTLFSYWTVTNIFQHTLKRRGRRCTVIVHGCSIYNYIGNQCLSPLKL